MKKKISTFKNDSEAEEFLDQADLSEYDLSDAQLVQFEFQPKIHRVTMRLSEPLFKAIQNEAEKEGMPYQWFIRKALENAVHLGNGP